MQVVRTAIPDVLIVEPRVFGDDRGYFFESYNERELEKLGLRARFVQDNHSRSGKNVLRGLHYQIHQPQGKLVRVTAGEIFDVAVDIRRSSPHFGKWVADVLSHTNRRMMWIPPGFAHGFLVTSDYAEVQYKTTDYYAPAHERCIAWNDRDLAISWPLSEEPILSPKDRAGLKLKNAEAFP
jgi:dTDP-4-dehydrorhamnose 3,5-epimerase